jgi:hypothetical protein
MNSADDYRERADRTRLLAAMTHQLELETMLRRVAQEYDELADRLDAGNPPSPRHD